MHFCDVLKPLLLSSCLGGASAVQIGAAPKTDHTDGAHKSNRELLQHLTARQAEGVPDCVPSADTRMERAEMSSEPSCSARSILLGVPRTSPPTGVRARATKELLMLPQSTGPRWAKRDKIKPFAITQVELSSFY